MSKTKVGQFDHYKKWKTDQGYTFLAKDEADAKLYLIKTGGQLGSLEKITEK